MIVLYDLHHFVICMTVHDILLDSGAEMDNKSYTMKGSRWPLYQKHGHFELEDSTNHCAETRGYSNRLPMHCYQVANGEIIW